MDDLISRQAAIERINKQRKSLRPNLDSRDYIGDAAYRICIEALGRLPSVDIDKIIASHEEVGYERGLRDGYAQAVTESDAERKKNG